MVSVNESETRLAHAAALAIIATVVVYVVRRGYYSDHFVAGCLLTSLLATLLAPTYRWRVVGLITLAFADVALLAFGEHTASGELATWRMWQIWPGSFVWLPVLVLALVGQILTPARGRAFSRPASAVAAAAFVAIPAGMSDVITGYERLLPSIVVVACVAVGALIPLHARPTTLYVWSIAEPAVIVVIGWLAVANAGAMEYVKGDLRWLLPYLALPAMFAACATNWPLLLKRRKRPNSR